MVTLAEKWLGGHQGFLVPAGWDPSPEYPEGASIYPAHCSGDTKGLERTDGQTDKSDRRTDRQTRRQTGKQTVRQTDRQTDRRTDRQTDRQAG
jgi:hypothetical protein